MCVNHRPTPLLHVQQLTFLAHCVKNDFKKTVISQTQRLEITNKVDLTHLHCLDFHGWQFRDSQLVLQTMSPKTRIEKSQILIRDFG